ncbi:hypothetical protein MTO96_001374 [Rhipicephalus appendiculatus]
MILVMGERGILPPPVTSDEENNISVWRTPGGIWAKREKKRNGKARPESGACCDSGCPGCSGLQIHQAWPLCFSRRVAIQLCEIDSSVLRPGDFYLAAAVGPEDRGPGPAKLVLKYRDDLGHLCSRRIDAHDLGRLLAMDWTAPGQETDEQLVTLLKHLLVSVERGLERIEWDSLLAANKNWLSGHRPENCPCKSHASSPQQQPEDANDSEGPTGYDESAKDQATGGFCPCSKGSSSGGSSVDSASRRTSASSGVDPGPSSSDDSSSREGSWAGMLLPDGLSALFRERTSLSREEEHDDGYCDNSLAQPTSMSQLGHRLLLSRVACFPGCRDVNGRGIAIISSSAFKDVPELTPSQLAQMLMYFYTIPKKEISVRGFLLLANINNAIDIVVVANAHCPLEVKALLSQTRAKIVQVTSQEKLLEFVDKDNLLPEFGGTYTYDHQEWMSFRKFLEPFVSGCRLSGRQLLIDAQKRHIQDTFRDEQLRHLQEEGDTILQELQAYRARSPHNLDYRDALEKSGLLYNELKRAMAKLTKLADKRLQRLQECMLVRTFEEESSQVLSWICKNGAEALSKHFFVADSLSAIQDQEYEFEKFYFLAMAPRALLLFTIRAEARASGTGNLPIDRVRRNDPPSLPISGPACRRRAGGARRRVPLAWALAATRGQPAAYQIPRSRIAAAAGEFCANQRDQNEWTTIDERVRGNWASLGGPPIAIHR